MSVSHNPNHILSKHLEDQADSTKSKSVRAKTKFILQWAYPEGENDEKRDVSDRTNCCSAFNFDYFMMKFYIHDHETLKKNYKLNQYSYDTNLEPF